MTDRITIAAYRTHAEGRTQIVLSQTDENGRGHGYRIAGPKHYNSGVTELISADLTARDAAEIRAMLDAAFPVDQSQHRDQVLTEAADLLAAEAARGIHIRYGSATDYADHYRAVLLAARTGQEG
ncbi:hypothetical protein [Kitasatospora cineracea]|uniref:hypothetical protein n=1 Tax=Kitasatospora cineracea TaxID=88074 RepID=UPI0036AA466F